MALSDEQKTKLLRIESTLKEHPFPPQVIIETTSRCNFRCRHCAHKTMSRKKADMPPELFYKIIDEIAAKSPQTEIWPAFYGEPLLIGDRLFEYIRYAKEKGCNNIFLNTNGSLLNQESFRKQILFSGIKCVTISLDAFFPETFHNIRCGGQRNAVYEGVEALLREKEREQLEFPLIICQFVLMDENKNEVDVFFRYWNEKGADVKVRNVGSWTGAINAPQLDYRDAFRIACPIGNNTFAIQQNGNVAACCADYAGDFFAGNVKESSIETIWKTTLFQKIRKPFRDHKWVDIPDVCKRCRDWQICGAEYIPRKTEHKHSYPFWYEKQ